MYYLSLTTLRMSIQTRWVYSMFIDMKVKIRIWSHFLGQTQRNTDKLQSDTTSVWLLQEGTYDPGQCNAGIFINMKVKIRIWRHLHGQTQWNTESLQSHTPSVGLHQEGAYRPGECGIFIDMKVKIYIWCHFLGQTRNTEKLQSDILPQFDSSKKDHTNQMRGTFIDLKDNILYNPNSTI